MLSPAVVDYVGDASGMFTFLLTDVGTDSLLIRRIQRLIEQDKPFRMHISSIEEL